MPFLEISRLEKSFGVTRVVKEFNLGIEQGEFISLLGPSGCGKTTVLRMIAGFESPSTGSISIGGRDVVALRPNQRNIGMVFQAYALFPNLTVAQNVAFGLKVKRLPRAEIDERVAEMLQLIGLPHLGARFPFQLSGGQQQRVALARALATRPQVLLLDEPLSALDAKIRISLREEIRELQRSLGITTVFVTHDQEEALSISDRIVVMNEGRAEQIGAPPEIYNFPRTRFVASFVGTLNILTATVTDPTSGGIEIEGQPVKASRAIEGVAKGGEVTVALRPEALVFGDRSGQGNRLSGTVAEVSFLGAVVRIRIKIGGVLVSMDSFNNPGVALPARGADVVLCFDPNDLIVID
jgi:putative spermidine/putrescine transport system ATP-binding protein